uniref:Uncharacterized protein n=1 Tax=Tetranychus urticae TaxID=32264 RepID=T1KC93_TETUR
MLSFPTKIFKIINIFRKWLMKVAQIVDLIQKSIESIVPKD